MKTTYLILLASLTCIGTVLAVDPPPDGGYPTQNTAEGEDALFSLGTGPNNTAVGFHVLYSNVYPWNNTAIGSNALMSNVNGYYNTAIGSQALASTTYTGNNTAVGYAALSVATGFADSDNVAIGFQAMANAGCYSSTAVGSGALQNDVGLLNTAIGKEALTANTTGQNNTALGWRTLFANKTGVSNLASGLQSLFSNTTGNDNTAAGVQSLLFNTIGSANTADGKSALISNTTGSNNVAVGSNALSGNMTGNNNIGLGDSAGGYLTSGSNNIDIGNQGLAAESGVIRLGTEGTQTAAYIAGIRTSGLAVATGIGITDDGRLGVRVSSRRYKEGIRPMAEASEAIFSLQPVAFHYKRELDPKGIPQFGLVAEDVAKISSELVLRDVEGKPLTVRYDEVNVMLLNEFLKEHKKVEAQGKELAVQASEIVELKSALARQAEALEKVSAGLDAAGPTARLVENR